MAVAMRPAERALFESLLRCARNFVEFGAGGSTLFAAGLVKETIISLDSSKEWLDRVLDDCVAFKAPILPKLIYIDIGETKEWGFPKDESARDRWPDYYTKIWSVEGAKEADLYLVDGRFRVACFMQTLLNAPPHALIAIHDFANRANYHVVREVADERASAENFSVFTRKVNFDHALAEDILNRHKLIAQ
ncbi:hypothetical protein V5F77_11500 [Xanthobacter sp. DSM 24535]|uniref:hypothetical protein n=1 Tax=Roseixanthobacter psychrophilus TaxID=3119917 RepID=UPI0037290981